MRKITAIVLSGTAALFLSACGGSSSDSSYIPVVAPAPVPVPVPVDPMTERDGILIVYHYPADVCESGVLRDELEENVPEATNLIIRVEDNSVDCATYDKEEVVGDTEGCQIEDFADIDASYGEYDTSCVLGFDLDVVATDLSTIKEDMALEMSFTLDAVE